MSNLVFLLKC